MTPRQVRYRMEKYRIPLKKLRVWYILINFKLFIGNHII
jgi:hypothetical protein